MTETETDNLESSEKVWAGMGDPAVLGWVGGRSFFRANGKPSKWEPYNADQSLENGYDLKTSYRDVRAFSVTEKRTLVHLLSKYANALTPQEERSLSSLLKRAGFGGPLGIMEFDVERESREWIAKVSELGEEGAKLWGKERSWQLLNAMKPYLEAAGIPTSRTYQSNDRGGLHVEIHAPPGMSHPYAILGVWAAVKEAALMAGIPYLTAMDRDGGRESRPAVFLDDSGLNRKPTRRGAEFRVEGASKRLNDKANVKLRADNPDGTKFSSTATISESDFLRLANLAEAQLAEVSAREEAIQEALATRTRTRKPVNGYQDRPTNYEFKLEPIDEALIANERKLAKFFEPLTGTPDRSKRMVGVVDAALDAGVGDFEQLVRLACAHPGSKAQERGEEYAERCVESRIAKRRARRLANQAKPLAENLLDDLVAAGLGNSKAASSLMRVGGCRQHENKCKCGKCKKATGERRPINCDSWACYWCQQRWIENYTAFVAETWPDKLYVRVVTLPDRSVETALAYRESIARAKKEIGKDLRDFISPGRVLIFTTQENVSQFLVGASEPREVTSAEAARLLETGLQDRSNLCMLAIKARDVDAAQGWLDSSIHLSRGGKRKGLSGKKNPLPWPQGNQGKKARRRAEDKDKTPEQIREDEESSVTPCCAGPYVYALVKAGSDVELAESDRPFTRSSAKKFAKPAQVVVPATPAGSDQARE